MRDFMTANRVEEWLVLVSARKHHGPARAQRVHRLGERRGEMQVRRNHARALDHVALHAIEPSHEALLGLQRPFRRAGRSGGERDPHRGRGGRHEARIVELAFAAVRAHPAHQEHAHTGQVLCLAIAHPGANAILREDRRAVRRPQEGGHRNDERTEPRKREERHQVQRRLAHGEPHRLARADALLMEVARRHRPQREEAAIGEDIVARHARRRVGPRLDAAKDPLGEQHGGSGSGRPRPGTSSSRAASTPRARPRTRRPERRRRG